MVSSFRFWLPSNLTESVASDRDYEFVKTISSPETPIWRVAHASNPFLLQKSHPNLENGGRYDSPISGQYSILYFGLELEVCYGELLAQFIPVERKDKPSLLLDRWRNDSRINREFVPAFWREKRVVVSVKLMDNLNFVDMSAPETREFIFNQTSNKLSELNYNMLEEQMIFGRIRKITRVISGWIYDQKNEKGEQLYAGIYYPSRHNKKYNVNWNCWAVFADDKPWQRRSQKSVLKTDSAFQKVARLYGLKVH